MEKEEVKKALDAKFAALEKKLSEAQENGATKQQIVDIHKQIEDQGAAIEEFVNSHREKQQITFESAVEKAIVENKEKIQQAYKNGGQVEIKIKAVAPITTGSGSNATTPSHLFHSDLSRIDLRNDSALISLADVSNTNSPNYSYSEVEPKEGDYDFVAEGAKKPQIDFKWRNRFASPVKIAAYEVLTEESVTDVAGLRNIATTYLKDRHDFFKANNIYKADGSGIKPKGAIEYGRAFNPGGMADAFAPGTVTLLDAINAAATDIYTNPPFSDGQPFLPNVALINPLDFFLHVVSAKDKNGLPLYPQASMFNEIKIGQMIIRPWLGIDEGDVLIADMKKMKVINYVPYSIRIGWINEQFIHNQFTMVGESRYYQFVKNFDEGAFIYDSIDNIKSALEDEL